MDRAGVDLELAFPLPLQRAVDQHRHHRCLHLDREHEGAFLERPQWIRVAAGPFRIHAHRGSALDPLAGLGVTRERRLPVGALDRDHPRARHRRPEQRHTEDLGLGDELDPRQVAREREDVEVAQVVRNEDVLRTPLVMRVVLHHACTADPEVREPPVLRTPRIRRARVILEAQQSRDDHDATEHGGRDDEVERQQAGAQRGDHLSAPARSDHALAASRSDHARAAA